MYFARAAAETFAVGSDTTVWKGPIPLVLGMVSPISYGYAFALVLVLVPEWLSGASVGKLVTRSVVASADGSAASGARRLRRFLIKTSGAWLFCVALLARRWELVVVAALASLIVFVGVLLGLGPSRATLHDRWSATRVLPSGRVPD